MPPPEKTWSLLFILAGMACTEDSMKQASTHLSGHVIGLSAQS